MNQDRPTRHVMADPEALAFVRALGRITGGRPVGNDAPQYPLITDLGIVRIDVPVLLVHGDADSDVPPEHTDHAAALLPAAEVIKVAGGTHVAVWTDFTARDVQRRIAAFLTGSGD